MSSLELLLNPGEMKFKGGNYQQINFTSLE